MPSPLPPLIHVGISKSGTTSLQERVFAGHPALLCCGRPNHLTADYRAFHTALCLADVHRSRSGLIDRFLAERRAEADRQGCVMVLSDETLANGPFVSVVAQRLRRSLTDARILITIRNQMTSIVSHYVSHGYRLGGVPRSAQDQYVSFADWFDYQFEARYSVLARLDYANIVEIFSDEFGASQVTVLLLEDMAAVARAFTDPLGADLGLPADAVAERLTGPFPSPADSGRLHLYQRWRGPLAPVRRLLPDGALKVRLRGALDGFLVRGVRKQVTLTPEQRQRVHDRFADGNRRLAAAAGIDLATHGYPL